MKRFAKPAGGIEWGKKLLTPPHIDEIDAALDEAMKANV